MVLLPKGAVPGWLLPILLLLHPHPQAPFLASQTLAQSPSLEGGQPQGRGHPGRTFFPSVSPSLAMWSLWVGRGVHMKAFSFSDQRGMNVSMG